MRPRNVYARYHAHVYFDEGTVEHAEQLCKSAAQRFGVTMGRVHRKPVGPHPRWSCQLAFDHAQFDRLIPWLDENRRGLSILVHGLTGDEFADHTTHAGWLGAAEKLRLEVFRNPR